MNVFGWFLAALQVVNIILVIVSIGQPKKPVTRDVAAIAFVIYAAELALLLKFGTGHL